jgi:hypothetical protein
VLGRDANAKRGASRPVSKIASALPQLNVIPVMQRFVTVIAAAPEVTCTWTRVILGTLAAGSAPAVVGVQHVVLNVVKGMAVPGVNVAQYSVVPTETIARRPAVGAPVVAIVTLVKD